MGCGGSAQTDDETPGSGSDDAEDLPTYLLTYLPTWVSRLTAAREKIQ